MPWVELIRYPISRKVNQNREVKNFPMSGRMPHGFFRPGNTSIHSRPTRVNMHHIMGMVRLWLLSRAQSNYRSKRLDDRKWEAVPEPQSYEKKQAKRKYWSSGNSFISRRIGNDWQEFSRRCVCRNTLCSSANGDGGVLMTRLFGEKNCSAEQVF